MVFPEPKELMSSSLASKLGESDDQLCVASLVAEPDITASVTAMLTSMKRESKPASRYVLDVVARSADVNQLVESVGAGIYVTLVVEGPLSARVDLRGYILNSCEVTVRQEAAFCDVILSFEANT